MTEAKSTTKSTAKKAPAEKAPSGLLGSSVGSGRSER